MSGMRGLIAVTLVAVAVGLPAAAQRGGGAARGGFVGRSAGFASHSVSSAPAFRSSGAPIGRGGFKGSPQLNRRLGSSRYVGVLPRPPIPGRGVAGSSNRRSDYPIRRMGGDRYRLRYVPAYGFGFPYGVAVWPGYGDSGYYDDSASADSAYATQPAPADYAPEPYPTLPAEQAEAIPANQYRPAYRRPQAEPEFEGPVTLMFKDGRPPEQIHDYILTRTTLYVQGARTREIPVADLDLVAMETVNKAAGVDFQLPASR